MASEDILKDSVYDSLLKRAEWLMGKLPELEERIDNYEARMLVMSKKKTLNEELALRAYTQMIAFHLKAAELVRKTMVYFGPEVTGEQRQFMALLGELSPEQREDILLMMRDMTKGKIGTENDGDED